MIDPKTVCFFIPKGLSKFKNQLFERVGRSIENLGGSVIRYDIAALERLPHEITPIVGSMLELTETIAGWKATDRRRIQWDRGYARRVFATWLPRGENGGYYRWHIDAFQMRRIREVPGDRWRTLLPGNSVDARPLQVKPWSRSGRHIVVASPPDGYAQLHHLKDWTERTIAALKEHTDRPIVTRQKVDDRALQHDLAGAHCLVTHASIAAVEAVILGCPVFVDPESAAALVGKTSLDEIERPIYPDRDAWLHSLAYSQFNERELIDGTLWRLME